MSFVVYLSHHYLSIILNIFRVLAIFKPRFQPVYKTLQSNPKDKKNLDALDKPADQINPP